MDSRKTRHPVTPAKPIRRSRIIIAIAVIATLAIAAIISRHLLFPEVPGRLDQAGGTVSPAAEEFRADGMLTFLDQAGRNISGITVEIAENEAARTKGLMGRSILRPDHGMLFIFDDEEERAFWMANTPLPLDIIFVGNDFTIVKIHRNTVPFSEESLPSDKPARYVVEVNGGYCDAHGIDEGDTISFMRK